MRLGKLADQIAQFGRDLFEQNMISSHGGNISIRLGDRVIMMDRGRIVEQGVPAEVFESPREERTRQFFAKVLHH